MDAENIKTELEAAYKQLDKADQQIKNLLKERKQNQLIIEILETSGYITEGKLEKAINFVKSFYS